MNDNLMRKLAEFEPTDMPVLSVYLDMRPQATGGSPGVRSGDIVLKDRMNEIEKTYLPRGEDLDSFQADREKIEEFIAGDMAASTSGLVIFACSAKGLWETIEVGMELENEVIVGDTPSLFQISRLLDEHDTAVIAVVDTNTARFFVTRYGKLKEIDGPDDDNNKMYSKGSMGGWKQTKYQRNIDNNREDFAKVIVNDLEKLISRVNAKNLIIAGDEISTTFVQKHLSPETLEILHDEILRIDIKTSRLDIKEEVIDLLDQIERDDAASMADKLVSAVRGRGLGVAGVDQTRLALETGQVETLLIDPTTENLDEETREELIRLATLTSAGIEMVEGHEKFAALDGVGGLLRFKYDTDSEFTDNKSTTASGS
jgi:stalled ribosome rescue protein Dom34